MSQCSNMDIIQALIDLGSVSGTEWHIGNNAGTFEILNNCSGDILFSILNDGTLATGSNFSTNPEFLNQYSNITIGTQFGNYTLTSNYVLSTSNILVRRILREDIYSSNYTQSTSNYLILKANENDTNASNYILTASNNLINKAFENDRNASNYIMYTSNNLILKANFNDTNASNYILTASNNLINNTLRTSNNLINKVLENDNNSSNYIRSTSNNLINKINENDRNSSNYIRSTSNILAERINKYSVWEPTTSNIYYYSSGNVGIGTIAPTNKLHICETSTSNARLTIQNNYLVNLSPITPNEIIVAGATSVTINSTDRYISFPYSGSGATKDYTFTTTENLQCDILVVGGGGSGGNLSGSGGGGGGGYVYLQNINMTQGSYSVSVGKGGGMRQSFAFGGENGANSSINGGSISYTALGGGGGGGNLYYDTNTLGIGKNGGSGGGGGLRGYTDGLTAVGGTSTQFSTYGYGNGGNGNSFYYAGPFGAGQRYVSGGGGGGASGITNGYSARGNDGLANSITGVSVTYAGGGGAGFAYDSIPYTQPLTDGGAGGGGKGQLGGAANEDGVDGLGGGGGGANNTYAGKGGSGIVIIRYRCMPNIITSSLASASIELVRGLPADANTDYKVGNYNGDFKIMSSTSNVDISRLLLTSNGDITIPGSIEVPTYLSGGRNIVSDTSNYILTTSNLISNRITDLTTDMITENVNATKKFIVNNRYNNNLELNGTLTINSNLIVLGDNTRLDTIVYTTERLEILNANNTTTAFMVQQNSADRDIFVASNMTTDVVRIANNGDVNINGTGVYKRNNRDVIWDTSNYVLTASNNLILRANAIDANVSNYILSTSNILIFNANLNDIKMTLLCNTLLAVGTINDGNASNYVLTSSNNLVLKADMNDRNASNYVLTASNNLILKADMNDRNASNYVLTASNNLILKADMNDRNASNYVLTASNTLVNIIRARADAITTSQWTGSSNIYFNLGNVGIGTTNPTADLHLYDEVISDTKLTIQNNSLVGGNATTITPSGGTFTTGQITSSVDQFMIFTAGSSSFTVPAGGLNCDILMIGGGGGSYLGGGGAGACIVAINQTLPAGSCVVSVGAGGGIVATGGTNGEDSYITVGGSDRYRAKGGGISPYSLNANGNNGGCGGGAYTNDSTLKSGGQPVNTNVVNGTTTGPTLQTTYAVLGNAGGNNNNLVNYTSGGGGGIGTVGVAGGAGGNGTYQVTLTGAATPINFRNYFANGSTSFGVQDGTTGNYYIGGGGGGTDGNAYQNGGLGGGGGINNMVSGIANTGGGGGGGGMGQGAGGSGIVIIRYRGALLLTLGNPSIELIRGISSDSNTDYKIGNYGGDFKIMSSTSNIDTNRVILTSNGDMTLSGSLNATSYLLGGSNILIKVDDTSNYIRSASNLISQRITNLTTDMITESVAKKFIINNSYNNSLEVNGSLTVNSNLIVLGDSTRLDTIVYTTERLEVVNANNTTTAFMVQQNSANRDIFIASNMSATVFKIANNGDVHINGNYNKDNRDVIQDTSNYILTTSNLLINYNNLINRPGLTQWVGNSNITYNLGNVGIGTTDPLVSLHVVGEIASTNNITSYYSDERLKTKTGGIHEPLEIVGKLNGFYYIPNALARLNGITHTETEIGLSAQDVQMVLPEIVNIAPFDLARDADDNKISKSGENYLTISYERLAPVFVEAIKELKNEIVMLKQRVAFLEQK